jgi:hypothetical protein
MEKSGIGPIKPKMKQNDAGSARSDVESEINVKSEMGKIIEIK